MLHRYVITVDVININDTSRNEHYELSSLAPPVEAEGL